MKADCGSKSPITPITRRVAKAVSDLTKFFAERAEWICHEGNLSYSLRNVDIKVSATRRSPVISYTCDGGARAWPIREWHHEGSTLRAQAHREPRSEPIGLAFIPRASLEENLAIVFAARRAACWQLAKLAASNIDDARIERASLSAGARRGYPGRYTRITLLSPRNGGRRTAATSYIDQENLAEGSLASHQAGSVESFLSASLVWFNRLCQTKHPPEDLWLVVKENWVTAIESLLSTFRDWLRNSLRLYIIVARTPRSGEPNTDESEIELQRIQIRSYREILAHDYKVENSSITKLRANQSVPATKLARKIIKLAPKLISVIRTAHGETLLFNGLAFARVRSIAGSERGWFGVETKEPRELRGARLRTQLQELNDQTWPELLAIVQELKLRRSGVASLSASKQHAFYRAVPEKWLEAILRRDITQLDPGLILSPLYAQLRLPSILSARRITTKDSMQASRPIDLLALRNDGRLVVIELKTAPDRQIIFQGVDYWLRVEAHRRAGTFKRMTLFGRKKIADLPPLIYLVAPGLEFHRDLETLGSSIIPEIEIYRFCINENWRGGVRVMQWMKIN